MKQHILNENTNQFINRVEERSELFVRRGYNERLEEEYEFQHSTFQEYLASVAAVLKKYPNAKHRKSISDCFDDFWEVPAMQEVIVFAATYTNDIEDVQNIIRSILDQLEKVKNTRSADSVSRTNNLTNLLLRIVADEAELTPDDCNSIFQTCFSSTLYSGFVSTNFWMACESRYKATIYNSLMQIDKSRHTPIFNTLFELKQLHDSKDFSILDYYFEKKNTGSIFDAVNMLSTETWINWSSHNAFPDTRQGLKAFLDFKNIKNLNNTLDNIETLRSDLVSFCMASDMKLAKIAFQALYYLCKNEDDIFSVTLLQAVLKIFDDHPPIVIFVDKFPINPETLLILHGPPMSESRRLVLQEKMDQEMNLLRLSRYFIFGILCGAWSDEIIIKKAKKFHSGEYNTIEHFRSLYNVILNYFSALHKAGALNAKTMKLVNKYRDKYKSLNEHSSITEHSKQYTWDNIEELLKDI